MPWRRDWRSPEAADVLKDLDRSGVAWEFLRRDPEYCEHYASVVQRIELDAISPDTGLAELSDRWGCMFIRDPSLPADDDPLIWRPELVPFSVTLVAAPMAIPTRADFRFKLSTLRPRDCRAQMAFTSSSKTQTAIIACGFPAPRRATGLQPWSSSTIASPFVSLRSFMFNGALRDAPPAHCRRAGASPLVTSDVSRSCCARSTAISPVPAIERSPMRSSALRLSLVTPGRPLRSAARQHGSSRMPFGR